MQVQAISLLDEIPSSWRHSYIRKYFEEVIKFFKLFDKNLNKIFVATLKCWTAALKCWICRVTIGHLIISIEGFNFLQLKIPSVSLMIPLTV